MKKSFQSKFKESISHDQRVSLKQQFMIALTLSLLFGLGWGIGLLATRELYTVKAIGDVFASLFIILTAFQGIFIFLMFCVKSNEVRRECKSFAYKTTGSEYFSNSSNLRTSSLPRKQHEIGSQLQLGTITAYSVQSTIHAPTSNPSENTSYDIDCKGFLEKEIEANDSKRIEVHCSNESGLNDIATSENKSVHSDITTNEKLT